jgi:hypothetical protein
VKWRFGVSDVIRPRQIGHGPLGRDLAGRGERGSLLSTRRGCAEVRDLAAGEHGMFQR